MAKDSKKPATRVAKNGQIEMTIDDTPLYKACEELVLSKSQVMKAKKRMEDAEIDWCKEMKAAKKSKINHDGAIIQFIHGSTSEDHARFTKA